MAGRYKVYPEYKDAGVEWLDFLPISWQVIKVKFLLKDGPDGIKIGPFGSALKLEDMVDKGIRVYGQENVIKKDFTLGKRFISQSKYSDMKVYTAKVGDILITMMGTIGKCQVVPEDADIGIIDSHLLKLKTSSKIKPELFRLLVDETKEVKDQIAKHGKGSIMHGLNSTIVKELEFPVPSIEEQIQILLFLDHETAKIDTLIAKQEKLIELLKEKRQAVISHAVTKGLNPNAPMKDSGVEWLGEVPEHWKVSTNKHLMMFVTSGSRGWAEYYADEGKLFFRIANLTRDTIEPKLLSLQCVLPPEGSEGERSMIRVGDLLVSITADLGSVCVANNSIAGGYVSQHVALLRPNRQVASSRWLAYFILSDSAKEQLIGAGYGGTKVQLSLADLRELIVAIPPASEQVRIESYLDKSVAKFQQTMDKANQQIELLRERKSALISAAVTGKIDVRAWDGVINS